MVSALDRLRLAAIDAGFTRLKGSTYKHFATPGGLYDGEPVVIMADLIPARTPGMVRYEFTIGGGVATMFGLCEVHELPDKVEAARILFEVKRFYGPDNE